MTFRKGWLALAALLLLAQFSEGKTHIAQAAIPSAGSADCDVQWNEALHDSFDPVYRAPGGATVPGRTVRLRVRVAQQDITGARVRVWDDRANTETLYPMAWDSQFDVDSTFDWWYATISTGAEPTILYYVFELTDAGNGSCATDTDWYADEDIKFLGGGHGQMYDELVGANGAEQKSFQLTVYDPAFDVPTWMQRAIIYQIFPDRFRDGDPANNPTAGRFFYNEPGGAIVRSNSASGAWNTRLCDPRGIQAPSCSGKFSQNFYGGDLKGITDKLNEGYFDNLGVTALYLNPIFRAPSNHKYDTADYLTIDPDFGSLEDWQALAAAAHAHGIRLILDGVFNHTSSDSTYFDRYSRYNASGQLTSANRVGANDGSGACEAETSAFRGWFLLPAVGAAGRDGDPGSGPVAWCAPNPPGTSYEAWFGYSSLPKLRANSPAVRELFWSKGQASAGPYWTAQGASGWRFDVGADVDPGLTNDAANDYWEGFRNAVREVNPQAVTLGEEWGDASAWLLGNEWDSAMNYRFRSAVLGWLFTGCTGTGCTNGAEFHENDSNSNSSSGAISYLSPSLFNARLRSIQEDYPPMAFKGMMNLEGSHDTQRLRFLLKKINHDDDAAAVQRMKEWWLFAFTYTGAPTIYYGDEVGLSQDGVAADGNYQDDPYNRAPFPWDDTPGDFRADTANLLPHLRKMVSIRQSYRALQDGEVQHGIVIDDDNQLYGFARTNGTQTALIVLNRDNSGHQVTLRGLNRAPFNLTDGTVLLDVLEGQRYTVAGGAVTVTVNSNWGVVLLEENKIHLPSAPASVSVASSSGGLVLTWPGVSWDMEGERELPIEYRIYHGGTPLFAPDPANLVATVSLPNFGSSHGNVSNPVPIVPDPALPYYRVCAVNAAGNQACSTAVQ